ncbi:hypothetical protein GGU10DRAFT_379695, partial [Lentinula aff. detonsa]
MNPEPGSPFNDESSVPTASVGHPSTPAPAQQYTNQPVYYYLPSPASYPPQTPAPKNHSRVSTVGYGAGSDSETLPSDPIREALERILNAIQHEKWLLGKFLYYLFRTKSDDSAQPPRRSRKHAVMLGSFLSGRNPDYSTARIVKEWLRNPSGIPPSNHNENDDMFSLSRPFEKIQYARPALTSFAAQLVEEHLLLKTKVVVSPDGGLQTGANGDITDNN